jgi:ABC-type branched-subunit amino acid transport system substrate-binding protein
MSVLAGNLSVPLVDPSSSTASALADDGAYRYLSRLAPAGSEQVKVLAKALVALYGWRKVAVLHTADAYGAGLTRDLEAELAATHGLALAGRYAFAPGSTPSEALRAIRRSATRIVVLLCRGSDAASVFVKADALDMTGANGYLWAGVDGWSDASLWREAPAVQQIARGAIATRPSSAYRSQQPYLDWLEAWEADATVVANDWNGSGGGTSAPFVRDATWTLARALHNVCYANETACEANMANGALVHAAIVAIDFEGVTGRVRLLAHGERAGAFSIVNLQADGEWRAVREYSERTGFVATSHAEYWPGSGAQPLDAASSPARGSAAYMAALRGKARTLVKALVIVSGTAMGWSAPSMIACFERACTAALGARCVINAVDGANGVVLVNFTVYQVRGRRGSRRPSPRARSARRCCHASLRVCIAPTAGPARA